MEIGRNQQGRANRSAADRVERTPNVLRHDDDMGWSRPSQHWNQYGSHRWNTGGSLEDLRDTNSDWNPGGWGTGARYLSFDDDENQEAATGPYGARYHAQHATGQYYGRGPKGYQRPDDRILDEVCECLARDARVDAVEIEVAVNDGVVTLTGTVRDRRQKRAAEDALEEILGVKEIQNRIQIPKIRDEP